MMIIKKNDLASAGFEPGQPTWQTNTLTTMAVTEGHPGFVLGLNQDHQAGR